jgi:lysophospholipase L1-like esterase
MKTKRKINISLLIIVVLGLLAFMPKQRPTLFLIGDSTVKNGQGDGRNGQWGWGDFIQDYLDTTKIKVENHALGGTSSRTFRTRGLWESVLKNIKKGDIVMMQFGHNDGSPLDDTARARGTIKGIGDESKEIYNPITKQQEVVYSYGWYLTTFIKEAKAKGAQVYVCSPVPRDNWNGENLSVNPNSYPLWAKQVAKKNKVYYVDLNERLTKKYNQLGKENVAGLFQGDHTHTNKAGAQMNAETVTEAVKGISKNPLKTYILNK